MDLFQLKSQILFYLDQVKAPRFRVEQIAGAINAAQRYILEKAFPVREKDSGENFEENLRARSKYNVLVKTTPDPGQAGTITVLNNVMLRSSLPADYGFPVIAEVYVNRGWKNAVLVSHAFAAVCERDPYSRPSLTYPERIWLVEDRLGFKIMCGDPAIITGARIHYLSNPTNVTFGGLVTAPYSFVGHPNTTTGISGVKVYAETNSVLNGLRFGYALPGIPAPYPYPILEDQQALIDQTSQTLVIGMLRVGWVDPSLPDTAFEELARITAAILSGTLSDYEKKNDLTDAP